MITYRGRALIAWCVVFTFLDLASLAARFYTIRLQRRALRIDDYLVVVAVAAMLALVGCAAWAIHNGLGAHAADLTWPQTVVQIKLVVSSFWTWTIATVCCKLSMLFLYTTIFSVASFKRIIYVFIALTAAYAFAFIPYFMTQCRPVSAAWDPVLSQTNCSPTRNQELASVSVNMVLDLAIVILPAPLVWNLHMPIRKRLAVIGIFSVGFCIVGVMLWRLVDTVIINPTPDFPFDLYILALQSLLEVWLGIIAANLPTLGALFQSIIYPKVKTLIDTYTSDKRSHQRRVIHTFGSSGESKKPKRDQFGLLSEDSVELVDVPQGKNEIHMERDFTVTVERPSSSQKLVTRQVSDFDMAHHV